MSRLEILLGLLALFALPASTYASTCASVFPYSVYGNNSWQTVSSTTSFEPSAFASQMPLATTGTANFINFTGALYADFPGTTLTQLFTVKYQFAFIPPVSGWYTFTFTSDDGSALWINDALIVVDGGKHAPVTKTGTTFLLAGNTQCAQIYYWQQISSFQFIVQYATTLPDGTSTSKVLLDTTADPNIVNTCIPDSLCTTSSFASVPCSSSSGLAADYFSSTDLTGAQAASGVVSTINLNLGTNVSPLSDPNIVSSTGSVSGTQYSVAFHGYLYVAQEDILGLETVSTGLMNGYLGGGQLVQGLSNATTSTPITSASVIPVTAGRYVRVAASYSKAASGPSAATLGLVYGNQIGWGTFVQKPMYPSNFQHCASTPQIIVNPTNQYISGFNANFSVFLNSRPTSNVVITFNIPSNNGHIQLTACQLVFTEANYFAPQTVTVYLGPGVTLPVTISSTVSTTDTNYAALSASPVVLNEFVISGMTAKHSLTMPAPGSQCIAFGGAHVRTFDGAYYTSTQLGHIWLVRHRSGQIGIEAQYSRCSNISTCITGLAIRNIDTTVMVSIENGFPIVWAEVGTATTGTPAANGTLINNGASVAGLKIIQFNNRHFVFTYNDGLMVEVKSKYDANAQSYYFFVRIGAPAVYWSDFNGFRGVCGTPDGIVTDEAQPQTYIYGTISSNQFYAWSTAYVGPDLFSNPRQVLGTYYRPGTSSSGGYPFSYPPVCVPSGAVNSLLGFGTSNTGTPAGKDMTTAYLFESNTLAPPTLSVPSDSLYDHGSWPAGLSPSGAAYYCAPVTNTSSLVVACKNFVDSTIFYNDCIEDIRVSGTYSLHQVFYDYAEAIADLCAATAAESGNPLASTSGFCLNDCSGHGTCTGYNTCTCDNGWSEVDCSRDMSKAPVVTQTDGAIVSCSQSIQVFGGYFYDTSVVKCKLTLSQNGQTSTSVVVNATVNSDFWVSCPVYCPPTWIGTYTATVSVTRDSIPSTSTVTAIINAACAPVPYPKVIYGAVSGNLFQVTLSNPPSGMVNVTLVNANSTNSLSLSACMLSFNPTNWDIPQGVYVYPGNGFVFPGAIKLEVTYSQDVRCAGSSSIVSIDNTPSTTTTVYGAVCGAGGDPHAQTFDGVEYGPHFPGDFYYVKSSTASFVVQGRQSMYKNVGYLTGIAIRFLDADVIFAISNGVPTFWYQAGPRSGFSYTGNSLAYKFYFADDVSIATRWFFWPTANSYVLSFSISIPTSYLNSCTAYRGLCGVPDTIKTDEFMFPNGTTPLPLNINNIPSTYAELTSFVDAWSVPSSEDLFLNPSATISGFSIPCINQMTCTPAGGPTNPPSPTGTSGPFPSFTPVPSSTVPPPTSCPTSILNVCEPYCYSLLVNSTLGVLCAKAGVDPTNEYNNCVFDCCASQGPVSLMCPSYYNELYTFCYANKNVTNLNPNNLPLCSTNCNCRGTCVGAETCTCNNGYAPPDCSNPISPCPTYLSAYPSTGFAGTVISVVGDQYQALSPIVCMFSGSTSNLSPLSVNVTANVLSATALECTLPSGFLAGSVVTVYVLASNGTNSQCGFSFNFTIATPVCSILANPSPLIISTTTGSFTVKLSSQPTSNVTISITETTTQPMSLSSCTLTFTSSNWNVDQSVSVYPDKGFISPAVLQLAVTKTSDPNCVNKVAYVSVTTPSTTPSTYGYLCTTFGDPHINMWRDKIRYTTFDVGTYYIVRHRSGDLAIQGISTVCAQAACFTGVAVRYFDTTVLYYWIGYTDYFYTNVGTSNLAGLTVNTTTSPYNYVLSYADGLTVKIEKVYWAGYRTNFLGIWISLPTSYGSDCTGIRGLCGTPDLPTTALLFNGTIGNIVTDTNSFVQSYAVPTNENLFLNPAAVIPPFSTSCNSGANNTNSLTCTPPGAPTNPPGITPTNGPTPPPPALPTGTAPPYSCTGTTLSTCQSFCYNLLVNSTIGILCNNSGTDPTNDYNNCVIDCCAGNGDESICPEVSKTLLTECLFNANVKVAFNPNNLPLCSTSCSCHGVCVGQEVCQCTPPYAGPDCSTPGGCPEVLDGPVTSGQAGTLLSIFGNGFTSYPTIDCKLSGFDASGLNVSTTITVPATVYSSTYLSCTAPAGMSGNVNVTVVAQVNASYTCGTGYFVFTYPFVSAPSTVKGNTTVYYGSQLNTTYNNVPDPSGSKDCYIYTNTSGTNTGYALSINGLDFCCAKKGIAAPPPLNSSGADGCSVSSCSGSTWTPYCLFLAGLSSSTCYTDCYFNGTSIYDVFNPTLTLIVANLTFAETTSFATAGTVSGGSGIGSKTCYYQIASVLGTQIGAGYEIYVSSLGHTYCCAFKGYVGTYNSLNGCVYGCSTNPVVEQTNYYSLSDPTNPTVVDCYVKCVLVS